MKAHRMGQLKTTKPLGKPGALSATSVGTDSQEVEGPVVVCRIYCIATAHRAIILSFVLDIRG